MPLLLTIYISLRCKGRGHSSLVGEHDLSALHDAEGPGHDHLGWAHCVDEGEKRVLFFLSFVLCSVLTFLILISSQNVFFLRHIPPKSSSTVPVRQCFFHLRQRAEARQIFGGNAYTRSGLGEKAERLYRDVGAYAIPGGSEEILLDLAIRQGNKSKL